jgi:16S rRNA processing protein RimM
LNPLNLQSICNLQSEICNLMDWDQMALVGRIARPHGLRGQVIVNAETDFPEMRFQPGADLFIERDGKVQAVRLTTVRFHRERPVIGIEGVESIDDAGALAGYELRVPLEQLAPLPAGAFYRHDLIGCRVETGSGDTVGTVSDVEGTLSGSRLVIAGERGEILVPLATAICTTIDLDARRIVIEPPEGLLELNIVGRRGR